MKKQSENEMKLPFPVVRNLAFIIDTLWKSGRFEDIEQLRKTIGTIISHSAEDALGVAWELSDLCSKLDSIHSIKNMALAIDKYLEDAEGVINTTDIYTCLHVTTRAGKQNVSKHLSRLADAGVLERTGKRVGQYRKKDTEFTFIQSFGEEDSEEIKLNMPLGEDRYARIFKSNVIVVAGQKDAGKTGYCLNFATANMGNGHNVRYISSEFGGAELLSRLEPMDLDPNDWIKKVQFTQYFGSNYEDAIDPDGINIVDFLESNEGKFYMVGEQIKRIYYKLRKGVALIALQKKKGQEYARGGELSAEKSRLYVTLGSEMEEGKLKNIATILHCKNRAVKEINANGLYCEYKLGGGYYFKRMSEWRQK